VAFGHGGERAYHSIVGYCFLHFNFYYFLFYDCFTIYICHIMFTYLSLFSFLDEKKMGNGAMCTHGGCWGVLFVFCFDVISTNKKCASQLVWSLSERSKHHAAHHWSMIPFHPSSLP